MIDWILRFQWNGLLGILLYWVPMVFCFVFYTARTAEGYMADVKAREDADKPPPPNGMTKYYVPRETIGGVLGRAMVSIIPVANIWAALFDLSPKVFNRFFGWLTAVFDQPLVPKSK